MALPPAKQTRANPDIESGFQFKFSVLRINVRNVTILLRKPHSTNPYYFATQIRTYIRYNRAIFAYVSVRLSAICRQSVGKPSHHSRNASANSLATARCQVGRAWAYMSSVTETRECPKRLDTTTGLCPCCKVNEA